MWCAVATMLQLFTSLQPTLGEVPHANDTASADASALTVKGSKLVRLHSEHPKRKPFPVLVRLLNPTTSDIHVTIKNPDNHLKFSKLKAPDYPDLTDTLDLAIPKPSGTNTIGEPVSFTVTGDKGSAKLGDAIIEINETGTGQNKKVAKWDMTVFWFKNPENQKDDTVGGHMGLQTKDDYEIGRSQQGNNGKFFILGPGGKFGPAAVGISFDPTVTLMPTDLTLTSKPSVTDPSIDLLRLGFEQVAGLRQAHAIYGSPTIPNWGPTVAGTITPPIPANRTYQFNVAVPANDSASNAAIPFYQRDVLEKVYSDPNTQPNANKQNLNVDGPYIGVPEVKQVIVKNARGIPIAVAEYKCQNITLTCDFTDWCTIGDNAEAVAGQTQWLIESKWKMDINLATPNGNGGKLNIVATDVAPTDVPIEIPPRANDLISANPTNDVPSNNNVTFTAPNLDPNP